MKKSAVLSSCGQFRYQLERVWDETLLCVCWVMLNPSTADATQDDATIRRIVNFSKLWGYGRLVVVNLFAVRLTDSRKLWKTFPRTGPSNDEYIAEAARTSARVVVAWGANGWIGERDLEVARLLRKIHEEKGVEVSCLGRTNDGRPKHPLRLAKTTALVPFFEAVKEGVS